MHNRGVKPEEIRLLATALELAGVTLGSITVVGPTRIARFNDVVRAWWSAEGVRGWMRSTARRLIRELWTIFIAGRFKTSIGREFRSIRWTKWRIAARLVLIALSLVAAWMAWSWADNWWWLWRGIWVFYWISIGSIFVLAAAIIPLVIVVTIILVVAVPTAEGAARILANKRLYGLVLLTSFVLLVGGLVIQIVQ